MRAIFISYRRDDAEGQAGRLFADLALHFGDDAVFMDVTGIEPGRDFRRAIDQHVASCGVLLAMIGRSWVDAKDDSGRRRLDDPMDFVRLETASALKRDIPVIPVLVQGARMPRADQLPPDLAELAYRNGVELTHSRWDSDVQVLIKALSPHVELRPENAARTKAEAASGAPDKAPRRGVVRSSDEPAVAGKAPGAIERPAKRRSRSIVAASLAAVVVALGVYVGYEKFVAGRESAGKSEAGLAPDHKEGMGVTGDNEVKSTPPDKEAKQPALDRGQSPPVSARTPSPCAPGYVWRKAFPDDDVCVLYASAARAAADNRKAESRWQPGSGGSRACKQGYVFRESGPQDEVCVTPETRKQTALENRHVNPRWLTATFPPPNGGALLYTIMPDGNPACASYDAASCLWGQSLDDVEFERLNPLVCGEGHRAAFGVTGYETPEHWCSIARRSAAGASQ
jgi:hypothetical protein